MLHAQVELHVVLNLANCEAHSRQIASLNDLPHDQRKTIWLNRSDSALTPWVVDRFGLEGIKRLGFRYLSPQRFMLYLGEYGTSTCLVTVARDTVDRFPLEALPARVPQIKDMHLREELHPAKGVVHARSTPSNAEDSSTFPYSPPSMGTDATERPAAVVRTHRWKVERTHDMGPISSALQMVATTRSVWLLDEIVGTVYRMEPDTGDRCQLVTMGDARTLMQKAALSSTASVALLERELSAEGLLASRSGEEGCSLVIGCSDTTSVGANGPSARYQQVVLTLGPPASPPLTRVVDRSDVDGRGLMLTPSGLGRVDSAYIAQIFKLGRSDAGHPLFAQLLWQGDSMCLGRTVPFNYYSEAWEGLKPYQFVNGHFSAEHFIYASAPRIISLRDGKESDLSGALAIPPGPVAMQMKQNYFTMSMHSGKDTISIVYFIHERLYLARIGHAPDGYYTPIDRTPIPLEGHDVKAVQLIGTDQLFVLPSALDELVLFTFE